MYWHIIPDRDDPTVPLLQHPIRGGERRQWATSSVGAGGGPRPWKQDWRLSLPRPGRELEGVVSFAELLCTRLVHLP